MDKYVQLAVLIVDKNGQRMRTAKSKEIVGNMKFRALREAHSHITLAHTLNMYAHTQAGVETILEPMKPYTIFPSTYEPKRESPFSVTVFCRCVAMVLQLCVCYRRSPFKLVALPKDAPFS